MGYRASRDRPLILPSGPLTAQLSQARLQFAKKRELVVLERGSFHKASERLIRPMKATAAQLAVAPFGQPSIVSRAGIRVYARRA